MLDGMYESFFGLHREPFSVAPDPRFLFLSPKHREALSHLMYGLRGGGGMSVSFAEETSSVVGIEPTERFRDPRVRLARAACRTDRSPRPNPFRPREAAAGSAASRS